MGTSFSRVTVVAKVCRAQWKEISLSMSQDVWKSRVAAEDEEVTDGLQPLGGKLLSVDDVQLILGEVVPVNDIGLEVES